MNMKLTQEQIEAYQREGFLIVPSFLGAEELEELRSAVGAWRNRYGDDQACRRGQQGGR